MGGGTINTFRLPILSARECSSKVKYILLLSRQREEGTLMCFNVGILLVGAMVLHLRLFVETIFVLLDRLLLMIVLSVGEVTIFSNGGFE